MIEWARAARGRREGREGGSLVERRQPGHAGVLADLTPGPTKQKKLGRSMCARLGSCVGLRSHCFLGNPYRLPCQVA